MHFEIRKVSNTRLEIYFKSSKEEIFMGTLQAIDDDGDERPEVLQLFSTLGFGGSALIRTVDVNQQNQAKIGS